jgi:hypothetical protein
MYSASAKRIIVFCVFIYLFLIVKVSAFANGAKIDEKGLPHSYTSTNWKTAMNAPEEKGDKYPDKRKITPETIRVTLEEYYIPQVSELLGKGVDCFEWVNQLDDPYLNRYKLDLKVDPQDDRVNLFWKRDF